MENREIIAGLYGAFGRGDIPAVLAALDPEIRWHEAESNPYMPSGEPYVGPETVLNELFARLAAEWDGFSVHPAAYHGGGDVVVVEGRYSGTHHGTGKTLDAQVWHIWTLRDGQVIKFQQYVDTAKLQVVMGATAA